jgi:pimeloyl-ACP methyl ester carboxylesterase
MIAVEVTGQGEPLVLLHGIGTNGTIWRRVIPSLAAERIVVAPDLPGLGRSDAADAEFDLDAVAGALSAELARRASAPFDLVGNSLGGAIALLLAARHPELVRRLVLVSPAGFTPRPPAISALLGVIGPHAIALRRRIGSQFAWSATARRVLLWGNIAEPQRLPGADARAMLESSRGSAQIGPALASIVQADLRDELAGLTRPLGVIWGERDRVVPIRTLEVIRELRPDAVVETIPRAAHVPHVERPEEFVAVLRRVLGRL